VRLSLKILLLVVGIHPLFGISSSSQRQHSCCLQFTHATIRRNRWFVSVWLWTNPFPVHGEIYRRRNTDIFSHTLTIPSRTYGKQGKAVRRCTHAYPQHRKEVNVQSCHPTLGLTPKYLQNGEFEKSQNLSEHGATGNSTMVAHSTTKAPCTYPYSGIQTEASGRWASQSGCVTAAANHTGATVSRSGHIGSKKNSSLGWKSDSTFLSRGLQLH